MMNLEFDNLPEILEGIGDLENAINRTHLQLEIVSRDLQFHVGGGASPGTKEDKALLKRLTKDLFSLLGIFPKMCKLLSAISGDLGQLGGSSSTGKNESTGCEEDFGISPDFIKIEECGVDEMGNDGYHDGFTDTDRSLSVELPKDVIEGQGEMGAGAIERPISNTRNKKGSIKIKRKQKSRIRHQQDTTTNTVSAVVNRGRKQNLKFMSSCKDGREIVPLSPFVLLMDDVNDKMNNAARRNGNEGTLSQRIRRRVSRKIASKGTDGVPVRSSNDQHDDVEHSNSVDKDDELKDETVQSDSDMEKSLSSSELGDADITDDYDLPSKKASCKPVIRKKRTKSEISKTRGRYIKESSCSICSNVCPDKKKLRRHVLMQHPHEYFNLYRPLDVTPEEFLQCVNVQPDGTLDEKFPYICWICGRPMPTRTGVREHSQTHCGVNERKYQCEQCGQLLQSQARLQVHSQRHHTVDGETSTPEVQQHICSCCDKEFLTRRSLRLHLTLQKKRKLAGKEDEGNKRIPCSICNKMFISHKTLDGHMRIHYNHGLKPFVCPHPECGKGFRQLYALNTHIEGIHSETEKYHCTICGKKFRWRVSHAKHMASHDPSYGKKILCSMCPKMFITQENLKVHISGVHDQVRSHACHLCPKRFKSKPHLKYHINTHNNPGGRKRGLNRVKEMS